MSFVTRKRRGSTAMGAVPLRRQDTGIYHEHQGEMYVANEYNAVIRKREEQQRKDREKAKSDGEALRKMIMERSDSIKKHHNGVSDADTESCLDNMPLYADDDEVDTEMSGKSHRGRLQKRLSSAGIDSLELDRSKFSSFLHDHASDTFDGQPTSVGVSGATRDMVQKLPSSIDANVIRVSKATVTFLGRTFPCTIMLIKECLLFSTPGYQSKIQGDSIPLHEVIRCQRVHKDKASFQIECMKDGFNSGCTYEITVDLTEVTDWVTDVRQFAHDEFDRKNKWIDAFRENIRLWYTSTPVQLFIAALICANFFTVAYGSQVQPKDGDPLKDSLEAADKAFLAVFCLELAINMFSLWFLPFWRDGWNIFDFVVIVACVTSELMANVQIPGLTILRTTRAFRIMRLAGKLKSLKRIIAALTQSIVPVANSFIILLTAGCIFSVLGVEFFGYRSVAAFGTFSRAAWTLWMVLAFGEWSDEALPVFRPGIGTIDAWVLLYIVMLVFVMLWVLLQVVVALLLDNFVQSKASSDAEDEASQLEEAESQGGSCLQPLIKAFLLTFDTAEQLDTGIMKLFLVLDVGAEGWIDFQKAKVGLRKIRTRPTIHLLEEEWEETTGKLYVDNKGRTKLRLFHDMLVHNIKTYIQRGLTDIMAMNAHQVENHAMLAGLRYLMLPGAMVEEEDLLDHVEEKMDKLESLVKERFGGVPPPGDGIAKPLSQNLSDLTDSEGEVFARAGSSASNRSVTFEKVDRGAGEASGDGQVAAAVGKEVDAEPPTETESDGLVLESQAPVASIAFQLSEGELGSVKMPPAMPNSPLLARIQAATKRAGASQESEAGRGRV